MGVSLSLASFQRPIKQPGRVLLVTAHPDDETMFFVPTVVGLLYSRVPVFLLCLSTGNADGLGNVRKRELFKACQVLGIGAGNLDVVDDPELQDGMHTQWRPAVASHHIIKSITKHKIDTVITFDAYGVSGHPNHKAVYAAILECIAAAPSDSSGCNKLSAWVLCNFGSNSFGYTRQPMCLVSQAFRQIVKIQLC